MLVLFIKPLAERLTPLILSIRFSIKKRKRISKSAKFYSTSTSYVKISIYMILIQSKVNQFQRKLLIKLIIYNSIRHFQRQIRSYQYNTLLKALEILRERSVVILSLSILYTICTYLVSRQSTNSIKRLSQPSIYKLRRRLKISTIFKILFIITLLRILLIVLSSAIRQYKLTRK